MAKDTRSKTELFCGTDVGAATTKCVLIDAGRKILGHAVVKSGVDFVSACTEARDIALKNANAEANQIVHTVATGYGRNNVPFRSQSKTEITCHARGAYFYFPKEVTVVDIGGQDSKIIKVGADGCVVNFKMNRKCAAGTGMFLEEIANRLNLTVDRLEELADKSGAEIELGSFCTVFTQTEILARIREGVKVEDLVKGAFKSVVKRILEMDTLAGDVVMTGGVVAHNRTIVKMLSERLGRGEPVYLSDGTECGSRASQQGDSPEKAARLLVPPLPQVVGALGAAIIGVEVR